MVDWIILARNVILLQYYYSCMHLKCKPLTFWSFYLSSEHSICQETLKGIVLYCVKNYERRSVDTLRESGTQLSVEANGIGKDVYL